MNHAVTVSTAALGIGGIFIASKLSTKVVEKVFSRDATGLAKRVREAFDRNIPEKCQALLRGCFWDSLPIGMTLAVLDVEALFMRAAVEFCLLSPELYSEGKPEAMVRGMRSPLVAVAWTVGYTFIVFILRSKLAHCFDYLQETLPNSGSRIFNRLRDKTVPKITMGDTTYELYIGIPFYFRKVKAQQTAMGEVFILFGRRFEYPYPTQEELEARARRPVYTVYS